MREKIRDGKAPSDSTVIGAVTKGRADAERGSSCWSARRLKSSLAASGPRPR
jgi:hypothetical protein